MTKKVEPNQPATAHTPTPWNAKAFGETIAIDATNHSTRGICHINAWGNQTAGIPHKKDKAHADLVAACSAAMSQLDRYLVAPNTDQVQSHTDHDTVSARDHLRAALRKAGAK